MRAASDVVVEMNAFATLVEPLACPNPYWIRSHLRRLGTDEELLVRIRFSPGELARRYGVTLRQMERYFLEAIGTPPKPWLQERRIQMADRLLREGGSVKAVALHLGYSSGSALAEQYRRRFDRSPSRVRRRAAGVRGATGATGE